MNDNINKRVCITGAAGNLGCLTARHFIEHTDFELHLITHSKALPAEVAQHERVAEFRCDLADKETLLPALKGVDEVFHFAGLLFKPNPEKFLPETNTAYFQNLIEAAQQSNVKKIVLISFPHVEGPSSMDQPSTDKTDRIPISVHAQTRLEEEKLLLKHYPQSVILRVGMVYGGGILMPDAAKWLAERRILGVWKEPTNIHLISKDDFLEAVRMTSVNPDTTGIYNIGDDGVQTLQEYLEFCCKEWGCSHPWRFPLWFIYFAARLTEILAKSLKTISPLTKDFIDIGRVSYYGDTRRMKKDLLPRLKYPTMKDGVEIL